VPPRNATATGIPIHPKFAQPKDRITCRRRHRLGTDRPIVLQMGGGHGVGPIGDLYQALLRVEIPIELVVLAGDNAKVRTHLEAIPVPPRHCVHVLGFTRAVDALMAAADLIVTKPGGLPTSEALESG